MPSSTTRSMTSTRLLLASVPVISKEEEALRPRIPLIDGEIPDARNVDRAASAGGQPARYQ